MIRVRRGDRGSALVEFLVLGIGVMVPVGYLALAATSVQAEVLARAQAVREAARAFATAPTVPDGRARALAAVRIAFADHGLQPPSDGVQIGCTDGPCLSPGSSVDARLSWSVPMPWVPLLVGSDAAPVIPVSARHVVPIDDYRADPR